MGPDGSIWFGTMSLSSSFVEGTVYRNRKDWNADWHWSNYTATDAPADEYITAMAAGRNSAAWSDMGVAVSRLSPDQSWSSYAIADGLADNEITTVVAGRDGSMWFATFAAGVSN